MEGLKDYEKALSELGYQIHTYPEPEKITIEFSGRVRFILKGEEGTNAQESLETFLKFREKDLGKFTFTGELIWWMSQSDFETFVEAPPEAKQVFKLASRLMEVMYKKIREKKLAKLA